MQVADKYFGDAMEFNLIAGQLHLGTFTAIDEKTLVKMLQYLSSGMPIKGGYCGITSKNG